MDNNSDVNVLKSERLVIDKNVIEMDDSIIQLSNVASVSLRFPPRKQNSPITIIGAILGFMMLFGGNKITIMGIVLLASCGALIYNVWNQNQNLGKNIIISTAGGAYFWINSKDDSFSLKVIDIIRNLMNDPIGSNITVNFDKFNIMNNGNIVYGNVQNSNINKDSGNISNSVVGNDNQINNTQNDENIPELRI